MKSTLFLLAICMLFVSHGTWAKEFPAQGRIFLGAATPKLDALNQEMAAEGLKGFNTLGRYGAEITFPVLKFLEVGMGYSRRGIERDELNSSVATNYHGTITQDVGVFVARVPFFKTELLRMDVFAGAGGSNTSLEFETARYRSHGKHRPGCQELRLFPSRRGCHQSP